MRPIDADRLLEEKRMHTYYHLPNGDIAIPIIDIENAPTVEPKTKMIAQVTFDEDKMREIVNEAVERFKEEYDIVDNSDAVSEWIPCKERLPEADGLYLATFALIGIPKFSNVESFKNGKWECHNGYIIAWQPLPKPWEGKDK